MHDDIPNFLSSLIFLFFSCSFCHFSLSFFLLLLALFFFDLSTPVWFCRFCPRTCPLGTPLDAARKGNKSQDQERNIRKPPGNTCVKQDIDHFATYFSKLSNKSTWNSWRTCSGYQWFYLFEEKHYQRLFMYLALWHFAYFFIVSNIGFTTRYVLLITCHSCTFHLNVSLFVN